MIIPLLVPLNSIINGDLCFFNIADYKVVYMYIGSCVAGVEERR
jgi:hypothetical protein